MGHAAWWLNQPDLDGLRRVIIGYGRLVDREGLARSASGRQALRAAPRGRATRGPGDPPCQASRRAAAGHRARLHLSTRGAFQRGEVGLTWLQSSGDRNIARSAAHESPSSSQVSASGMPRNGNPCVPTPPARNQFGGSAPERFAHAAQHVHVAHDADQPTALRIHDDHCSDDDDCHTGG